MDASVRRQGQKEMTVLDCVRPHRQLVFRNPIVERPGRAYRTRERERSELELVRPADFHVPRPRLQSIAFPIL